MITYLVQSILISAIFTLGYFIMFRKSKRFQMRRAMILLIPILSLLIPFANQINMGANPIKKSVVYNQVLDTVHVVGFESADNMIIYSYDSLPFIIYSSISLVLLVLLVLRINSVFRLRQNAIKEDNIFIISDEHQAFSFFSSIFIPATQRKNMRLIIEHEIIHVNQKHSIDIIYFEILNALLWFNPIILLLKKELSATHEFYVDQVIIGQNTDVEHYYKVLLENGPLRNMAIGNNFNNSLTKSRFIMMTKSNNKERLTIRLIGMIFILSSMIFVFQACDNGISNSESKSETSLTDSKKQIESKAIPKTNMVSKEVPEVDVYPSYPGGDQARISFIAENTVYPEIAKKDTLQGMVYVSFIVSKDGSLKDLKVLRGVSPEIDAEALRVVSIMPNWIPAEKDGENVDFEFTIPFRFVLSK
ncbi:MAG: hypothetical protein DRI84_00770 [Bacteroidetes bacterium]|nr:MAG: hypothetical protein DRI84_00770 [Bacteroidota bacterium]